MYVAVMSVVEKNRELIRQFKAKRDREKGAELLRVLPQGPGSGLDADLLDGMHAGEVIANAIEDLKVGRLLEELRKRVSVGGGGGGGMQKHGDDFHDVTYALADKTRPSPWVAETDVPVLTDAKYPNALLLDGSRDFTGTQNIQTLMPLANLTYSIGDTSHRLLYLWAKYCYFNSLQAMDTATYIKAKYALGASITFRSDYGGISEAAKLVNTGLGASEFQIPRAGNITLLDDNFLKVGKDSDGSLPTPSADYRGKMIRIEGGPGVADHIYVCQKLANDSYSWVQLD